MPDAITGQCLCGAVRFRLAPPLGPATECHCGQCRRWHGHTGVYTNVPAAALEMIADGGLAWYRSSDIAARGFCRQCGSSLFWRRHGSDIVSVTAGSLDPPTGLAIALQIFTEDKGDYYDLDPRIPVRPKAVT